MPSGYYALRTDCWMTFPGNLIAIATGVATVLGTIAPFIGSFANGIDFVPKTGLAQVHKGEKITPAAQNNGNGNQLVAVVSGEDLHFLRTEYERKTANSS